MVNTSTERRMALSVCASLRPGLMLRSTFSTNAVDGASMVAEAVDMMADSKAPKKAICSASGMWFITKAGRIFCGSSAISACTPSGMISTAAVTINMGTKANTMYSEPPMTGPSCATVASLDDMTRWNTSCCGMEPSIMVMPAAIKNSQVLPSAFSGSKRSLPCVVA